MGGGILVQWKPFSVALGGSVLLLLLCNIFYLVLMNFSFRYSHWEKWVNVVFLQNLFSNKTTTFHNNFDKIAISYCVIIGGVLKRACVGET